jgi:hypothetical protein
MRGNLLPRIGKHSRKARAVFAEVRASGDRLLMTPPLSDFSTGTQKNRCLEANVARSVASNRDISDVRNGLMCQW